MKNLHDSFYGQQEGEKILYSIKPHQISQYFSIAKIILASLAISSLGFIILNQIPTLPSQITLYFLFIGIIFALFSILNQVIIYQKTISYITNRRVIRFSAHTPFATSIRSLTWDQAAKAKTLPPNAIFKMLMIGNITIHSISTVSAVDTKTTHNIITNDDIEISNAYYYKDLGNYIEKIIYTFKNEPDNLKNIKPFIPKPKGKRY
jgi:hypothetical protein